MLSADPKFSFPIVNVTASVGREAFLTCVVQDLGSFKVSTKIYAIKFITFCINNEWKLISFKCIQVFIINLNFLFFYCEIDIFFFFCLRFRQYIKSNIFRDLENIKKILFLFLWNLIFAEIYFLIIIFFISDLDSTLKKHF